jgi:putative DNA primase/helicase
MTQTQHQQVSPHVDTLADQTLARYRQHQERERQHEEDRVRQQDQQAIAVFKTLLETEVATDLLTALSVTYEAHHERNDIPQIAAVFSYAGVAWHLSQEWHRQPGEWRWAIRATHHGYGSRSSLYDLSTAASPQALRTTLFLKLGERREQLLREEQEATERQRRQQQAEEEAHATQEREAQKRALRIAHAVQEHRTWSEQLDALKQEALQQLWRWPDKMRVSLYHVSYCAGIGRDDCKHSLLLASGPLASVYLDASAQLAEEAAQAEKRLDPELLQHLKGDDPHLQRYEWLRAMTGALIGRAKALKKLKRAQAVLTYAQAYLRITSREWDTHPWLLACANGVLDLQRGELQSGKPEEYLKTAIPTEWTALETPAPRWDQFLQELFQDKPEQEREALVTFLQRLLGYGITGSTVHHVFTILYGEEGRNGKDTLLDTLKDVLGPLVGAVSNDLFVAQDKFRASGAPTPHLCDLQGKRLVWGSETRQGDKLNIAQIKLLSGGGEISTRQLHGRQYSFTPTHKLLLMTNYKPHADARDQAFWSRACLIEFGIRFVTHPHASNERQADPRLKDKLKEERSGILAWLVRDCLAFQELGLAIPASISLATEKYRDEEDRILHFLNECCVLRPEATVKASVLYEAYKAWREENQFGRGMNATLFGNEIGRRFAKKRGNTGMIYQGVSVLTTQERGVGGVYSSKNASVLVHTPESLFDLCDLNSKPYGVNYLARYSLCSMPHRVYLRALIRSSRIVHTVALLPTRRIYRGTAETLFCCQSAL